MKTILLATAAAATLIAAPAFAQESVGSVGLGYTHTDTDGFKTDGATLDGVTAMKVAPEWTVTLNGAVAYSDSDLGDDTVGAAAAHLTKTFGSDLRAGGFVGVSDIGGENYFSVGGEMQKYLASATLTGVVAYTDLDGSAAWTIGGDAAYYVNPSLRLNAGVSYNNVDVDTFGKVDAWAYGVGAEYQLDNSPISLFGGYQRVSFNDVDLDSDNFTIGARYNFGGALQTLDRAGANLGRTLAGLPGIRGF
ncbi:outer membrane beta-barrel protein [Brevundimonas sp.]|uniref:outer membrane protein n=1 Tax=Brevundimonas sp. TaxID=1871086 RepID=UPI0028B050C8|nr:outer membrane beta-barrel protein [Brevundimonas sp.]